MIFTYISDLFSCWTSFHLFLCSPWRGLQQNRYSFTLQPVENPTPEQVGVSWKNCSHGKAAASGSPDRNSGLWRTCAGAGERCEEEGAVEKTVSKWPHSPVLVRGAEELGMREWGLDWEKRQWDGGRIFLIIQTYLNLLKIIFPEPSSPMVVIGKWSSVFIRWSP